MTKATVIKKGRFATDQNEVVGQVVNVLTYEEAVKMGCVWDDRHGEIKSYAGATEIHPVLWGEGQAGRKGFMHTNNTISWVPDTHLEFEPDCPRCEKGMVLSDDYLCRECRFGVAA